MIKSPLNYIGGKYRLLPQILPLFPVHINTFVDLFSGGLDVALNVKANRTICNDINHYVVGLFEYFQQCTIDELLRNIHRKIQEYDLSKQNREAYNALREDYNSTHSSLLLFLLVCYGFNHQFRFNSNGEFNNPFGINRSSYNANTEKNLKLMHSIMQEFEFHKCNFRQLNLDFMGPDDFLYADPPYLISCGSYNDGKRGFEGKVTAVNYTRKNNIPTLGICFGMQAMTINQARLKGIKDATSSEISDKGTFVLDIIVGKDKENIGGTLRLGADTICLKDNSQIKRIYEESEISERSRHRYEVNPKYISKIEDKEFKFTGYNKSKNLIEVCELENHPFYIGVQYHPEFNAKPLRPSKLFSAFIKSIIKIKN